MKKGILFFIMIWAVLFVNAQMLYTSTQLDQLNANSQAFENQVYKDTDNNLFYIGLSTGKLKSIGDISKVDNVTLDGSGTVATPFKLAQQGATEGQFLRWDGTRWAPYTIPVNKKMVLSAEYPGAIITPGPGSNHKGDMIGGNTGGVSAPRYMNYYQWTGKNLSGIAVLQSYQIIVRITLPSDFVKWQSSNAIQINYVKSGDASLSYIVYDVSNGSTITSQTPTNSAVWSESIILDSALTNWKTAGKTATFVFTLSAPYNSIVRLGDITLNYQ